MKFRDFFSLQQQEVIRQLSNLAPDRLYAVGGIVRDYLLGKPPFPKDIDLMIEGDCIAVAKALHRLYPHTKLQTFPKFLTAELVFPEFVLDIASARREAYPYPGANPQVTACSFGEDLARRDFTVNALAIAIRPDFVVEEGAIIDHFHGLADLERRLIRPIKSGTFVEDPRRIFRAIRFAVKLDFALATETVQEIQSTIASNIHRDVGGSRFRAELLYILAPDFFPHRSVIMLEKLESFHALSCIHHQLRLPANLGLLLRRLQRWHSYFLPHYNRQELALELLASNLSLEAGIKVELIRGEAVKHLTPLPKLLHQLPALTHASTSRIVNTLENYELPTLVLAGVLSPDRLVIWQYLTRWRNCPPLVNGHDLQKWGCPRGKTIGLFLKELRSLQLDGKLHSYQEAEHLVKSWLREYSYAPSS